MTLDNGSEFARFKAIEKTSKITVYFADPYASYQRGTNENSNGLLRFQLESGVPLISAKNGTDPGDRVL
ncbi:MAG: IS30 family transposase [Rhodospirillales bacterium]|nr:IS30 family transposase [Rhodospirillales bacterium]